MAEKESAKVLIVDDDRDIRDCLVSFLSNDQADYKFDIHQATSGRSGFQMFKEALIAHQPFNVIFMDIHMPEWDGLTAAECMRTLDPTSEIIVVSSSVEHTRDDIVARLGEGVGYAPKPISGAKARELAAKAVEKYKRESELEKYASNVTSIGDAATFVQSLQNTSSVDLVKIATSVLYKIDESISAEKMQNLLYYVEAWSLAMQGRSQYVDVLTAIGSGAGIQGKPEKAPKMLTGVGEDVEYVISLVVESYGKMSDEALLHTISREEPWRDAWNFQQGSPISRKHMREFYTRLFTE